MIKRIFKYIEPLWLGTQDKISIRRVLALFFSYNLIRNITFVIEKWEMGKSYSDVAILLGIEATLIAALLTLTTYSNMIKTKLTHGRPDHVNTDPNAAPFD